MTQAYFDEVAARWETMREGFFSTAVREKALAAAGVRPGERALDVGAGSGFVAEALVAAGLRVAAVDAAPRMVEELGRRFPGLDARVADAESLPFADATFDHAFANMCLHHVERPWRALAEMARVVRPGGSVVVTDLDAHAEHRLRHEQHDRWMGFHRPQVEAWLEDAGLAERRVEGAGETCRSTGMEIGIFLARGVRQ